VYGVDFNSLLCLNNMPIKRYADWLMRNDKLSEYMQLLVSLPCHMRRPQALAGSMVVWCAMIRERVAYGL
jgi:hypothetical protein